MSEEQPDATVLPIKEEAPKPRRKHRKMTDEEKALKKEERAKRREEEKGIPKTRDRKAYMKEYYKIHKSPVHCHTCTLEFACHRALQHHLDHNVRCLVQRILGIVSDLKDVHPDAHAYIGTAMEPEVVRLRNVMGRAQQNAPKSEEAVNVEEDEAA